MMRIDPSYIDQIRNAHSAADLHGPVQQAIKLEHATIPPYLCGYFSLMPGSNETVGRIIRSVVIEEMLHMTIASNLLIALGGKPAIDAPDFVPTYPGGLPMGIGDGLQVHLAKCSIPQVRDVFMEIEEPEEPLDIPTLKSLCEGANEPHHFDTIGAFYEFLKHKIQMLGDGIFTGTANGQVIATRWFAPDEVFPITDVDSASRAIEVIVEQGEGTTTSPFDPQGIPAHYYRFMEIVEGAEIVHRPHDDPPYAFDPKKPVKLDEGNVWNMQPNPKAADYKPGSLSRRRAEQFNYAYTNLLRALHRAFNGGGSSELDHAMGAMYQLKILAHQVLSTPAAWADPARTDNLQTGLSFEYHPVMGGAEMAELAT